MSPPSHTTTAALDAEFERYLRSLFEEQIVFNRLLSLKMLEAGPDWFRAGLPMRPDLIGNFVHDRLHGGVISALLDVVAGMACICALGSRHPDKPLEQRMKHFDRLGTIDLRVDYLRPAVSEHFEAKGRVVRLGSRVANTQMEFLSASGQLLATGAAAYIVS
ncbi:MAG: thioesterase family protein [Betaproteobacteria bacterium]|nr:thioesterase family protein [Betaproteobacteria bacterium]